MNLVKSEIAVKMNCKCTCKNFYTFVLKKKRCHWRANSNKNVVFKFKSWTKTDKWKIL